MLLGKYVWPCASLHTVYESYNLQKIYKTIIYLLSVCSSRHTANVRFYNSCFKWCGIHYPLSQQEEKKVSAWVTEAHFQWNHPIFICICNSAWFLNTQSDCIWLSNNMLYLVCSRFEALCHVTSGGSGNTGPNDTCATPTCHHNNTIKTLHVTKCENHFFFF